jgi:putative cardiolipin synthase
LADSLSRVRFNQRGSIYWLRLGCAPAALRLLICLGLPFVIAFLSGCASLPKARPEWNVHRPVDTASTTWARTVGSAAAEHPGASGIELVPYGFDALSARLALADTAERCLDLQYYIWAPDMSGRLMAERVLRAADRGVRVRLLLDDVGGSTSDDVLLALSAHTNIEVRIVNPIANRTFRMLSTLFDFHRVTRRMHNKSFTVDKSVAIVGGRNISDRYFGVGDEPRFADFEAIAAGPVVGEVATMFEQFWFSPSAIPIEALARKHASPERLAEIRAGLAEQVRAITNSSHFKPLAVDELGTHMDRHELVMDWGPVRLLYDQPEKITEPDNHAARMLPEIAQLMDATTNELLIVSPYFVPGKRGVAFLRSLRERGVRVVILSNSLAANDVSAVHAGYRRYRRDLLRAGVEMWEMKPDVHVRPSAREKDFAHMRNDHRPRSSLHTKTFIFDEQSLFVGSLNLDPRSARLNTEMGLLIEIPKLAESTSDLLERRLPQNAYHVELSTGPGKAAGQLVWFSRENGREVRYCHEPQATLMQRLVVFLASCLPIESQL